MQRVRNSPLQRCYAALWDTDKVLRHAVKKGGVLRLYAPKGPARVQQVSRQRLGVCQQLVQNGLLQSINENLCGAPYGFAVTEAGRQRYRVGKQKNRKDMPKPLIKITTDGSCWNKDRRGGYGIVMRYGEHTKEIVGGCFEDTTSARMEIMGMIVALEHLKPGFRAELYCDNQYVVNTVAKRWLWKWIGEDFMKFDEKVGAVVERPNKDLWLRFLAVWQKFEEGTVELKWVRGHAGDPDNERCDVLANQGRLSDTILRDTVQVLSSL